MAQLISECEANFRLTFPSGHADRDFWRWHFTGSKRSVSLL